MASDYTFIPRLQKMLFAARCWGCGGPLSRQRDFCLACRKEILKALDKNGFLLRYEGAVKGLLSCLRGSAPRLASGWCLGLLDRSGQLGHWKKERFDYVALAPQNPRKEEQGLTLLGRGIAARISASLIQPFEKIGKRSQHGKSLAERMDTACFVRLKGSRELEGKNILLLDDVLTTGTTLELCAYLLRKAGARSVSEYSLARQMMPAFERKQDQAQEKGGEVDPLLLHFFM